MELKALVDYISSEGPRLAAGETTEGKAEFTVEFKKYLVENFPGWFEVLVTEVKEEPKKKSAKG